MSEVLISGHTTPPFRKIFPLIRGKRLFGSFHNAEKVTNGYETLAFVAFPFYDFENKKRQVSNEANRYHRAIP
jgi:hypothetical protein